VWDFTGHVRRAISNFVIVVVDNDGDVERLQQIYTEGNYSLKPEEVNRLLILVDKVVNMNKSPEYLLLCVTATVKRSSQRSVRQQC
jgi:hypothetical protein